MEKKPKKRNGYYYINGKEYPSVTKIIGDTLAKPALYYWSGQQAAKIALKNPELNEKEVMADLQMVGRSAAKRGKEVHSYIEIVLSGSQTQLLESMPPAYRPYIKGFISWMDTHKPKTIKCEVECYSDKYGYAGRCDYVCEMNGEKWVLDFKTGKDIYKEVGLQLVAYQQALAEQEVIKADKTGCVLLMADGGFQFKETKDAFSAFLSVFDVWKWIKGVDNA